MRRRFHIVGNALAGSGRDGRVAAVIQALRAQGATIAGSHADSEAQALDEARRAVAGNVDAIVAAGGDGTIRLVAKAIAGSGVALGVIPRGTGNVLAHEIGLPRSADALARLLMEGPVRDIGMATANGEPFLLMVGVGFDGRVVAALDQGWKQRLGRLAYGVPVVRGLASADDALGVRIDGEKLTAAWAVVTNSSRYGGRFLLTGRTSIERSGLVAVLFHDRSRRGRLRDLLALASGRLDARAMRPDSGVTMHPCESVAIEPAASTSGAGGKPAQVPVQIDGDRYGSLPARLVIAAGGPVVRLIVPDRQL